MLSKITFYLLFLLFTITRAKILITASENSKSLSKEFEAVFKIINTCFPDEKKRTAIVGKLPSFINQMKLNLASVVLLDNSSEKLDNIHKLHLFIITTELIKENIQHLKRSPWWNHNGFFTIINNFSNNNGSCNNASDILRTTWKMDILKAIFICTNFKNKIMIYTFNPYSNRSPYPWKEIYHKDLQSKDPWVLYRQQFFMNSINCIALNFDKTRNLDGYRGILAGSNLSKLKYTPQTVKVIFQQLNATLTYRKINDIKIDNDENGTTNSYMGKLLANGVLDISLHSIYLDYFKDLVVSEIFLESGIGMISQFRGKKQMFDMIFDLFGWKLIIAIILISAGTIFMFKISLKMDISCAVLEIIRMWLNSGFTKKPKDSSSRIYLFGIFFFSIIMVSVFQGSILGFQTQPTALKNIETMKDLVEMKNYKIYGYAVFSNYLYEDLQKRYIPIDNYRNCSSHVLKDKESVCISGYRILREEASVLNLHVPYEPLKKTYLIFAMRKNWPLTQRINTILKKYFEYDLHPKHTVKRHNYLSNDPRPLKSQDFNFVFKILAIGNSVATACFIAELFFVRKKKCIKRLGP